MPLIAAAVTLDASGSCAVGGAETSVGDTASDVGECNSDQRGPGHIRACSYVTRKHVGSHTAAIELVGCLSCETTMLIIKNAFVPKKIVFPLLNKATCPFHYAFG